jgi:hypothetical protein
MIHINKQMALIVAMVVILLSSQLSYAQNWQWNNFNGDFGSTTTTVTGIGIGDFSGTNISSALHVNTNITAAQTGGGAFGLGEVFRTDAPNAATY